MKLLHHPLKKKKTKTNIYGHFYSFHGFFILINFNEGQISLLIIINIIKKKYLVNFEKYK
jgi:hypothetical protein